MNGEQESPLLAAVTALAATGARACLLRDEPDKTAWGDEIDLLILPEDLSTTLHVLKEQGWELLDSGLFEPCRHHLLLWWNKRFLKIDLYTKVLSDGLAYIDAKRYFANASWKGDYYVPHAGNWLLHIIVNTILEKPCLNEKYRLRVSQAALDMSAMQHAKTQAEELGLSYLFEFDSQFGFLFDELRIATLKPGVRKALLKHRSSNRARLLWHWTLQKFGKNFALRSGFSIAVIGPDGAGKTTFVATLENALNRVGVKTGRAYMGPWEQLQLPSSRLLRTLGATPLDIAQNSPARTSLTKLIKAHLRRILYYANFLPEMWARYFVRVLPGVLERRVMLLDRHAIDLQIGYYNEAMTNASWLRAILVRLSPTPRLFIFLDNDAELIWRRKTEFPLTLIRGALRKYRKVSQAYGMTVIRTDALPEQLVDDLISNRWRDFIRWRRDGLPLLRSRWGAATKAARGSAQDRHLSQMTSILRLWGSRSRLVPIMFWDGWTSQRNRAMQIALSAWFTLSVILRPKDKVIIHGDNFSDLSGEAHLVTRNLRSTALRLARHRRPFFAFPILPSNEMAAIVDKLGLDQDAPLSAFLSVNAIVVLFAHRAGFPVVLHIADNSPAWAVLDRHKQGLDMARSSVNSSEVLALMPTPQQMDHIGERCRLLSQTRLPGTSLSFQNLSENQLWSVMMKAMLSIHKLHTNRQRVDMGPDHELIFHGFPMTLASWPSLEPRLRPVLEELKAWQQSGKREAVLTHGDYWMGNVLFDSETLELTGIIDWETARLNGTPGLDALHFGLMSIAMGRARYVAHYIGQLLTGSWDDPVLEAYVAEVMRVFNLSARDIEHIGVIIYLDMFRKLSVSEETASARKRRDVLLALLPVISNWLASIRFEVERDTPTLIEAHQELAPYRM